MSNQKRGALIVLSGPSGAGKSTVIGEVMRRRGNVYFSVSFTTRAPREGEQEGVNYHYVDNATFEDMIAKGEFLEYAGYVDHYYGTSLKLIESHRDAGEDVILDIEVQGAAIVRNKCPDAVLMFLAPPTFTELSRRLHARQSESEEVIQGRLTRAKEEYQKIPDYDYLVINDTVDKAADEVCAIMDAAACRVSQRLDLLKEEL
jgi:guanylate kinase